jgi:hypothetical protein
MKPFSSDGALVHKSRHGQAGGLAGLLYRTRCEIGIPGL